VGQKWEFVSTEQRFMIRSPEDVYSYLRTKVAYEKQEIFYVLYLNTKNQVIYERAVFKGSLIVSLVYTPKGEISFCGPVCGRKNFLRA
jgi:DNA repair protein RadC